MQMTQSFPQFSRFAVGLLAFSSMLQAQQTQHYKQTNLVSNIPGMAAATDPNLVNAWGMAASGASPVWIGANGSGLSVLYNGAGVKQALIVTMAGDKSVTGVAFSNVPGFFNGDTFLFANEDGTIGGWRGALGTTAETLQLASAANVYKGLTDATIGGNVYAYAANFRNASRHAGSAPATIAPASIGATKVYQLVFL
jgi:uncharacterized protein (TIGR03118 family)